MTPCPPPLTERFARATTAFGLLLVSTPAGACTLCHSLPAATIRARIFGPDLLWNMSAMALPLLLLGAIVTVIVHEPGRGDAA